MIDAAAPVKLVIAMETTGDTETPNRQPMPIPMINRPKLDAVNKLERQ